jgi:O-antigen/teichoic acid export membrane protein
VTQFDTAVPLSRSLPRDALVLAAGMAVANAGNYAFNLALAFLLGPAAYGALAALLALVLVGSVPGLALQAVVARRTRLAGAAGRAAWPATRPLVLWAGLGLAVLAALAAPLLVRFLHLGSALPVLWLALALAPTPLLFAAQGLLQGQERFGALAAVMVAGAAGKLAAGLALAAAGLGVSGALAGVAAGGALAALAGLRLAVPATRGAPVGWVGVRRAQGGAGGHQPLWREVGTATTGLLGLFLLANLDVLLARHYLDQAASGRYALGAVVAKIAFWAPQVVVTVVFTRLVVAADPRRLLAGSAALVAGFGALLAGGLAAADRLGLAVPVLGRGYAGLGPLLPLFAALGTALALVQLLLFEGIATRDRRMGRAVVAALAAEAALVAGWLHDSVAEVAGVALAVVVLLAGAGWWLLRRRLDRRPSPVPAS